jgi:hypothetical protein
MLSRLLSPITVAYSKMSHSVQYCTYNNTTLTTVVPMTAVLRPELEYLSVNTEQFYLSMKHVCNAYDRKC